MSTRPFSVPHAVFSCLVVVGCSFASGCYGEVVRKVRRDFRSQHDCDDVEVQSFMRATGEDLYLARGCGRTVEYVCATETRGYPSNLALTTRDTFCSARDRSTGPTAANVRGPRGRARASRVVDAEHGVTYVGLVLASSWWELRFIAPETEGRSSGNVSIVLRAATASSRLQRCDALDVATDSGPVSIAPVEVTSEGRLVQYQTTLDVLRTIAASNLARFVGCNVDHLLDEEERAGLRQLVLLATPGE